MSAGQSHTVTNLRGKKLYAAAFDGATAIRVRRAAADVQAQPERNVTIEAGEVSIDELDVSDRAGREIGKVRVQDADGVLVDPATDNTISSELSREIATWSAGPISVEPVTIDSYTGGNLPVGVESFSAGTLPVAEDGTEPISDTTSSDGAANAATLQLGKRQSTDVIYDVAAETEIVTEISTDGSTWHERDRITASGTGSILLTVAFEHVRAYATSDTNEIVIGAKGGT
ncbi:hypothetical protein EXE53_16735 [Halorubrum sp. SD626R]|uniref:hypothetical protein n=1 Tax=Halorubrum sp. SD626R TaxID=1419722 RepID=UPI0011335633|nr:hypothetical protein [Halorubrum sp. SD626R]TKX79274.1 hypothetical protein EXE53_16735 [Halorubrum sp. SD626R]